MTDSWRNRLIEELACQERPPVFWWRDDDAVQPGPALDQLLAMTGDHGVAPVLAVIPHKTGAALAGRLQQAGDVRVAVHGIAHRNRGAAGEKRIELNADDVSGTLAELRRGHLKLQTLFGFRSVPILVPPWNRISSDVVAGLPGCGFKILSCYGDRPRRFAADGLMQVNTHLDPVDWRGGRGLKDPRVLSESLVEALLRRRSGAGCDEPVGILTHHLVHDAVVWEFLSDLLTVLVRGGAVFWSGGDMVKVRDGGVRGGRD